MVILGITRSSTTNYYTRNYYKVIIVAILYSNTLLLELLGIVLRITGGADLAEGRHEGLRLRPALVCIYIYIYNIDIIYI